MSIVDQFSKRAKGFDWRSYGAAVPRDLAKDEYESTNDPAVRQALMNQAELLLLLPGVKRRHRMAVLEDASACILEAYGISRFILGTYRQKVSYSRSENEAVINAKRLYAMGENYDFDALLTALRGPALDAFLGLSQMNDSPINKILGARAGNASRLTIMVDGLRLALAEEELFHPSQSGVPGIT